ncbi:MAG TPA: hypothetical protein ENK18_08060 [Deltaproteobacteria bacterium]|nr:hypothetical protein [Deltaproteobacteria bacterium]
MSPEERRNAAEAIARAFHEHHRRLASRSGAPGAEDLWEELSPTDQQLWIAAASCVLDDMELASRVIDAVG